MSHRLHSWNSSSALRMVAAASLLALAVSLGGCDTAPPPGGLPDVPVHAPRDGSLDSSDAPSLDAAEDASQEVSGDAPLDEPADSGLDATMDLPGEPLGDSAPTDEIAVDAAPEATSGDAEDVVRDVGADVPTAPPGLRPPPLDPGGASTLPDAVSWLYTGPDAVQRGVAPGTIDPRRVVVLRGRVFLPGGMPAAGVTLRIADHPEFGSTLTRADGAFDLVVNGGGVLTLHYERAGHVMLERSVSSQWHEWVVAPDVTMTRDDATSTTVTAAAPAVQSVRGSPVSDPAGPRQGTVLVAAGTRLTRTTADGRSSAVSAGTMRLTELSTGQAALQGELPRPVAYGYAFELGLDEVAGDTVAFSQPAAVYVENFLGFPVGSAVPLGEYDRARHLWRPRPSGVSVRVTAVTAGLAELDTDGDGMTDLPAALARLGISDDERRALGTLYRAGQGLWRVSVPHTGAWGIHWGVLRPETAPPDLGRGLSSLLDVPSTARGSVIGVENQSLGESLPLAGTPFRLRYDSSRVPGGPAFSTDLQVTGPTVPEGLRAVRVETTVAGIRRSVDLPPRPSQTYTFRWDGRDAYGRAAYGLQRVFVRVGYVYPAYYRGVRAFGSGFGALLADRSTREPDIDWVTTEGLLGSPDARAVGLGGWTLDVHHAYEPNGRALVRSDGTRRGSLRREVLSRVAGNGTAGFAGDGGPASSARLNLPRDLVVAPDGTMYIADTGNHRVRAVRPDGTIITVVGTGSPGNAGDGGPGTRAAINEPWALALDREGDLYIADRANQVVRVLRRDGTIARFAGTGVRGFAGDDGPALDAQLALPSGVAVGADGVYISDQGNRRIRRVALDGTISTVAGNGGTLVAFGSGRFSFAAPTNVLATATAVEGPGGLAIAWDGSVYHAEFRQTVRRVDPYGVLTNVAGQSILAPSFSGDEGLAVGANLGIVTDVDLGRDGSVWIADAGNQRIRRVGADGIIDTVIGGGSDRNGDGGPALAAALGETTGIAFGPEGSLYTVERTGHRVRRIQPGMDGVGFAELVVPSDDGGELYVFDAEGRHLRTVDGVTAAVLLRFEYASSGALAAVIDGDGNRTTLERGGDGRPTAIVGPYGHRTALSTDARGDLASVTDPVGGRWGFTYHGEGGLLATMTDARGGVWRFTYDADGRLTEDTDAAGGRTLLALETTGDGTRVVRRTSPAGRVTVYRTRSLSGGELERVVTDPAGLDTITREERDGSLTEQHPDGQRLTASTAGDPRFEMRLPRLSALALTTPGGSRTAVGMERTAALSRATDVLSLERATETRTVNGRRSMRTTDVALRQTVERSPRGRQVTTLFDARGRTVEVQRPGVASVRYTYDARGRLTSELQGSRRVTLEYDARGQVERRTDPLGRVTRYEFDAAGRVLRAIQPGDREQRFTYDAAGAVASITPPGRTAHEFTFTPLGLMASHTAPGVGGAPSTTRYAYNADRALTNMTRADGSIVERAYDAAGRLVTITLRTGVVRFGYDPATGQLASVTAPGGEAMTYRYDGDRVVGETWAGTARGTLSRTYDNDRRLVSESIAGTPATTFEYDDDGLLTRAGTLSVTRDLASGRVTATTAALVDTATGYDGFGAVATTRTLVRGAAVYEVGYTRDDLGRITGLTETLEGRRTMTTYAYDLAGRLADVTRDGSLEGHYEYDANGNRLRFRGPAGEVSGVYDAQDRLVTYGDGAYTYNAAGDLMSRRDARGTTTYDYDPRGSLLGAALPDGRRIEYAVDGLGRRVGRRVDGALVQAWLYRSDLQPVAELDGRGAVVSRFVYGLRGHVPDTMVRGGVTYRLVSDHVGSVRLVIDTASGTIAQRLDYDAFGNVTRDTNPGFQPFGFAGGLYDRDTGLVRFGARDYDPRTGRWTTKDPIGFRGGDTNLYGYVADDPVNRIDPSGQEELIETETFYHWDAQAVRFLGLQLKNLFRRISLELLFRSATFFGEGAEGIAAVGAAIAKVAGGTADSSDYSAIAEFLVKFL